MYPNQKVNAQMSVAALPIVKFPQADHFHLRTWLPSDVGALEETTHDPYISLITTLPNVFDETEMKAWIDRQLQRRDEGIGYSMCIADKLRNQMLGMIGLWLTELVYGRARIGYWLLPSARGHGIAISALQLVTRWAFTTFPEIARIELLIESNNTPSIRTAKRANFSHEGLLRSYQSLGEIRRDFYMFSCIRSDEIQ